MHARTHIAGTEVNTANNAPSAALPLIPTQFTQASLIPKINPSTRIATPKMLMKRADGVGRGVALVGDTFSDVSWGDTQILSQIARRVTQRLLAPLCRSLGTPPRQTGIGPSDPRALLIQ
jgi:hypothetical protein